MTSKYDPEIIEKIRNLSIAQEIGVQVQRKYILMACPFPGHEDSTPSFKLNDDNSYYCFGCVDNKMGYNFIDFLLHKGYTFKEIYDEYSSYV